MAKLSPSNTVLVTSESASLPPASSFIDVGSKNAALRGKPVKAEAAAKEEEEEEKEKEEEAAEAAEAEAPATPRTKEPPPLPTKDSDFPVAPANKNSERI